jgi:hypothetical protein
VGDLAWNPSDSNLARNRCGSSKESHDTLFSIIRNFNYQIFVTVEVNRGITLKFIRSIIIIDFKKRKYCYLSHMHSKSSFRPVVEGNKSSILLSPQLASFASQLNPALIPGFKGNIILILNTKSISNF